MAGARWVQSDILAAHPDADVQVYAVYYQMVAGDRVAKWLVNPKRLIPDTRTRHFWDAGKNVGRYYEKEVTQMGSPDEDRIEWDAYFLYAPDAGWSDAPPEHVSWGRTIVDTREKLLQDFTSLLQSLETMDRDPAKRN